MFGLFKKQKGIKDLMETDLQKLFDEAEKMYIRVSTQWNELLNQDYELLRKAQQEPDTWINAEWIEQTNKRIEEDERLLNKIREVRENVNRLDEREAHAPIENRRVIVQDWYVYMDTLLNWDANLKVGDLNTSEGRADRKKWDDAERVRDIKLEEISKRLKAKLVQNRVTFSGKHTNRGSVAP